MDSSKLIIALLMGLALTSCSDDSEMMTDEEWTEARHMGKDVGNFTADEWYPGGKLGTTMNVTQGCYEDETPAVTEMGLTEAFNRGEQFFERNVTEFQAPFNGLGPAYVRKSCLDCHPGYGHGKRVTQYRAEWGNGYLLVIYHPVDGENSDDGPYVSEVTGMPQTRAVSPFLPPVDENGIHLSWLPLMTMGDDSEISATQFPDGERYELIYPELSIDRSAFNTNPTPWETGNGAVAFRLESTIGIIGSGLLDAIPDDSIKVQYQREAPYVELNPAFWDKDANDFAASAWYVNASSGVEQVNRLKKFTYAMTRGSLQDGAGANAIWNITNVTRSDRHWLYTTTAWAKAQSEDPEVISYIKQHGSSPTSILHPYYADGTDEGIANRVYEVLNTPSVAYKETFEKYLLNGAPYNGVEEMSDKQYYQFMVWHRGLAVPAARNLNEPQVQRGKQLFSEIGCAQCHRPSWTTGSDDMWVDASTKAYAQQIGKSANSMLPKYAHQTIWPYTDLVQHRLFMANDIRTGWCRTTPLWGRGLSRRLTGADDRLHDCRARTVIEAIMWHGYSKQSDGYRATEKFYNLPKSDRDAIVKFIESI